MRSVAVKLLVLLFAGLVIACPFEASGASHLPTSSSPEDGTFCGILHSSIAGPVPSEQPAALFPADAGVGDAHAVREILARQQVLPAWRRPKIHHLVVEI